MTIDEAIEFKRYLSKQPEICNEDFMKCEEHKQIAEWLEKLKQYQAIGTVEQFEWCKEASHWKELFKEKLEQYEAIGTVEEFKALKEKNEPKKPIEIKCGCYGITKNGRKGYLIKNKCPNCGSEELMNSFPCSCGQKLDWK
jgi:hypothetical protein